MDGLADVKSGQVLDNLAGLLQDAIRATDAYKSAIHARVSAVLAPEGKIDRAKFSANQHLAHGFAWIVTYVETLRETANWASRLDSEGSFSEIDALLAQNLRERKMHAGVVDRPGDGAGVLVHRSGLIRRRRN